MLVEISGDKPGPRKAVLKLSDRRFAEDTRVTDWTEKLEEDYFDFVRNGAGVKFANNLREVGEGEDSDDWTNVQSEVAGQVRVLESLKIEKAAYKALREHQGTNVPRLLEKMRLLEPSPLPAKSEQLSGEQRALLHIPGVLLEYIRGPTLYELGTSEIPRDLWQAIVDQAMELVHMFHDKNMVNTDLQSRNYSAVEDSKQKCGYRVMAVDFGEVRFRKNKSDFEWDRLKYEQDAKLIVGLNMWELLRDVDFEVRLPRSNHSEEPARFVPRTPAGALPEKRQKRLAHPFNVPRTEQRKADEAKARAAKARQRSNGLKRKSPK